MFKKLIERQVNRKVRTGHGGGGAKTAKVSPNKISE